MAKRRKDTEEKEDKPFKLPKFDEEKFLKKERRNIKATYLSVFFGIIMAFICFGFWALMGPENPYRWPLVLFVAIGDAIFLRSIFNWRKLDFSDFTAKNWFTSYAMYFFAWLIIFIVIINPPIYDDENPKVQIVVLPEMQEFGGSFQIIAKITDNAGVEKSGIKLTIDGTEIDSNDFIYQDNIFRYTYENNEINNETILDYTLIAEDINGRATKPQTGSLKYSDSTIFVPEPPYANNESIRPEIGYATTIKIKVNPDVTRVYYTLNDGDPINATKGDEYYTTEPKYEGWPTNTNVTMKVFAEKTYSFDVIVDKQPGQMNEKEFEEYRDKVLSNTFNSTIVDSQSYYFKATGEGVGTEEPPEAEGSMIRIIQVPGFEAIALIAALCMLFLIFKYKKKDRRK
jgi:hypothetical protein